VELKTCQDVNRLCSLAARVEQFERIHCVVALKTTHRLCQGAAGMTEEARRVVEAILDRIKSLAPELIEADVKDTLSCANLLGVTLRHEVLEAVLRRALELARLAKPGSFWAWQVLADCTFLKVDPESEVMKTLLAKAFVGGAPPAAASALPPVPAALSPPSFSAPMLPAPGSGLSPTAPTAPPAAALALPPAPAALTPPAFAAPMLPAPGDGLPQTAAAGVGVLQWGTGAAALALPPAPAAYAPPAFAAPMLPAPGGPGGDTKPQIPNPKPHSLNLSNPEP
jgi:hypothetical protein